jgi:hypothetical protein
VENFIPHLTAAGLEVIYIDYGYEFGVETKRANPFVWRTLLPCIEPGSVLVGHSNGAAICYDAMNAGAKVKGCVFINGALDPRITRAVGVSFIDVLYNPGDTITEVAQVASDLGITDPSWGMMGHVGYWGSDPEIHTINCGATPALPVVSGHDDWFMVPNQNSWGPFEAKRIVEQSI